MAWDWAAVDQIADDVVVGVGIAVLIVRQFVWRPAELHRMLRLPGLTTAAGLVYLAVELREGSHWVQADWIIMGELVLVAMTGTAMGYVTRFRIMRGRLQYRLTAAGVALWGVFLGIRVGFFFLAAAYGATLGDATGLILLSFGVNRLAATAVVRRRALELPRDLPIDVSEMTGR
jgi:hypothetical protein